MKRLLMTAMVLLIGIVLLGCGATAREIQRKSESSKTGIFAEIRDGATTTKGFAELRIKAGIKTHLEGYYMGEAKGSLHGKQGYPFLINIDGQAVVWKTDGVKDSKPKYDTNGKTSIDPEAGEGVKYALDMKVSLRAGSHKVFFGLPEDNYSAEMEISMEEGETGILEFRPVYKTKRIPSRIPSFLEGIDRYEVFLNEEQIK